jgi:hypothetical protein
VEEPPRRPPIAPIAARVRWDAGRFLASLGMTAANDGRERMTAGMIIL